ncbi:MAG: biopolymer transporter ExbD [Victivallaceae bacterium]
MRPRLNIITSSFAEPEINLTPLIDVVFVILMAFMVIMPLIGLDTISLADTQKESVIQTPDQGLIIKVFADNRILLNDREMSLAELTSSLIENRKIRPEIIPLLLQDGNSSFRIYQSVKEAAEQAGFSKLNIALNPK